MVDSLAMFFGAKGKRTSPKRKSAARKSYGSVVVKGRERKLYKGKNGGMYYRTKTGKAYVDASFIRAHKSRASPKRRVRRSSPKRRRASPKRRVVRRVRKSPKRRSSPKRKARKSPKRVVRRTRWGYGLGQPSLLNMMGPAGLTVMPTSM